LTESAVDDVEQIVAAWEDDLLRAEQAEHERDLLAARLADAEARCAVLADEVAALTTNGADEGVHTAADAVAAAAAACTHLEFHPDAFETARTCVYRRPDAVLGDLLKLDDIVGRWRHDGLPHGLAAACRQAGLAWRSDISTTARTRFRRDYEHVVDGEVRVCGAHLSRGAGAPPTLHVRIHFWVDSAAKRVVVCYVGKHLRDATNR
jgi:hypothetical protein